MHILLSLSLHFYLLGLLSTSCDGNDATPATWRSMGKHITKCHWRSCWSVEKAVTCMREGERTSLWTSAKIKPAHFRFQRHQLFSEPPINSLPKKTRYVSRELPPHYLKANKVSTSEETRKSWKCIYFLKVCWCRYPKSVHVCRNYTACQSLLVILDTVYRCSQNSQSSQNKRNLIFLTCAAWHLHVGDT